MISEMLHALEHRRLLSASTPSVELTSRGTLIVHGSMADDSINVFLVHGAQAGGIGITIRQGAGFPSESFVFREKFNAVRRIVIDAGAGNDTIDINGVLLYPPHRQASRPIPATVLGGAGDDAIYANDLGPLLAVGGSGNDTIEPAGNFMIDFVGHKNNDALNDTFHGHQPPFANTLLGGAGNDILEAGIDDVIDGGVGHDEADVVISSEATLPDDRLASLAHDYYGRLGASAIESTRGISVTSLKYVSLDSIKSPIDNTVG